MRESRPYKGRLPRMFGCESYITDDRAQADRILEERMVPAVHRPEDMLRERLPIGPPELFAES